jgi:uncharacterized protein (DUF4415 family)
MEKVVNMTSKKMREYRTKNKDKIKTQLEAAPEFTNEDIGVKPGPVVARGFAAFKEYINKNGRPKVEDPKVSISIRIPLSCASALRATGKGWQTRTSEFVVDGINDGKLVPPELLR